MSLLTRALASAFCLMAGHRAWTSFTEGRVKILYKQFVPFTFTRHEEPFLFWLWIIGFTAAGVTCLVYAVKSDDN